MAFLRTLLDRLLPARGDLRADDDFARRLAGLGAAARPQRPMPLFRTRPSRRAA